MATVTQLQIADYCKAFPRNISCYLYAVQLIICKSTMIPEAAVFYACKNNHLHIPHISSRRIIGRYEMIKILTYATRIFVSRWSQRMKLIILEIVASLLTRWRREIRTRVR